MRFYCNQDRVKQCFFRNFRISNTICVTQFQKLRQHFPEYYIYKPTLLVGRYEFSVSENSDVFTAIRMTAIVMPRGGVAIF